MSHDTWIHRSVRHGVRALAHTPLTPNHITTVRLLTGVAAAYCFAVATPGWTWTGAGLFLFSMLCDRADGELARLTGKTSPWGHFYDLASDGVCDSLVLLGAGIGLRDSALGHWAPLMGAVAAIAVACIFWMVVTVEARRGPGTIVFHSVGGIDPDDAVLVIPVALVLGWGTALLAAAAVCAPLAAVIIGVRLKPLLAPEPADTQQAGQGP